MSVETTIHGTGTGVCGLTQQEGEGLTVTFKDGTLTETFLSWKGFRQLLALKTGKNGKKTVSPPAAPPAQPTIPAPTPPAPPK